MKTRVLISTADRHTIHNDIIEEEEQRQIIQNE